MATQLLLARQPVLDRNEQIFGYEFFYRNQEGRSEHGEPRLATSSVLVSLLNQLGLKKGVGDRKAFINVSANILLTDILYGLPKDVFVFELSEEMVITNKDIEAIAQLHKQGYAFALDNISCNEEYFRNFLPVFPYITYAKVDTTTMDIELLASQIGLFRQFKLIAQKVEIYEVYEVYRDMGFDYFQGYFFAEPHLIRQERIDPKYMGVIHLFNMLQSNTPLDQVAEAFQHENELSMQLINYLNSISTFQIKETSSIREAIEHIGSKSLEQWLLLLIYSKSGENIADEKSPQSLLIQRRIDIMLGLLDLIQPSTNIATPEQVRFLAFMSLLETTFNVPLASILENFDVSDIIKDALLNNAGELGLLFALTLSIERSNLATTQVLLKHYHLTLDDITPIVEKAPL